MAILGTWTGGIIPSMQPGTAWTAPNGLFPTQTRNDASAYTFVAATSTLTLPATDLADGYLIVAVFEFEDSSNGRHNPQGKIVQTGGTGVFAGPPAGGYNRDNSEDRAYVSAWAFVDDPSAAATFQFQWKRDTDVPGATDGTVRSSISVTPLFYESAAVYTSTSAALYGGTTPNQVTGFSGTDGANVTLASNVATLAGLNRNYLCLGGQFFEGRGGRTQRWHGFRIDGVKDDGAKAVSYYRSGANDEVGDMFATIVDVGGASVTLDQFCYRGDGIASGQGGANVDGSTPSVGDHATVILELSSATEWFQSDGVANTNIATTGPVDLDISGSFAGAVDVLAGFNISAASQNVASGARFTGFAELTIAGAEQSDIFAGDYLRGNQGTTDTFGWSASTIGALSVAGGANIGVSATELVGSEGHGGAVHIQPGWARLWAIDLDSMVGGGGGTLERSTGVSAVSIGGAISTVERQRVSSASGASIAIASASVERQRSTGVSAISATVVSGDVIGQTFGRVASISGLTTAAGASETVRDRSTAVTGLTTATGASETIRNRSMAVVGFSAVAVTTSMIVARLTSASGAAGVRANWSVTSNGAIAFKSEPVISGVVAPGNTITIEDAVTYEATVTVTASSVAASTGDLSSQFERAVGIVSSSDVVVTSNVSGLIERIASVAGLTTTAGASETIRNRSAAVTGLTTTAGASETIRNRSVGVSGASVFSNTRSIHRTRVAIAKGSTVVVVTGDTAGQTFERSGVVAGLTTPAGASETIRNRSTAVTGLTTTVGASETIRNRSTAVTGLTVVVTTPIANITSKRRIVSIGENNAIVRVDEPVGLLRILASGENSSILRLDETTSVERVGTFKGLRRVS